MSTKDIRTTYTDAICDICGRTLLRGERAEMFVHGSTRHAVCELCKTRALHEGWVREGAATARTEDDSVAERRRVGGLRLRLRRRGERPDGARRAPATMDEELSSSGWDSIVPQPAPVSPPPPAPPPPQPPRERIREPRHVRAVPMGDEHKVAAAMEAFNSTEHRRTVAGVARSLGSPAVKVLPDEVHPGLVRIVVAWELCWYRYEVDLSEHEPSVRLDTQGYELDELSDAERVPNATADDVGQLHI
jgi:hypothetical protein